MKPIGIANRQINSKQKIKQDLGIMNKYSMDPIKNNNNNNNSSTNFKLTTQKNSNLINLTTNINKTLFNKSSKNKIEKNTSLVGTININMPNRENNQNPTVLKSSYISGALFQDILLNKNNNKIFSGKKDNFNLEQNQNQKPEKEEKNLQTNHKFYPIANSNDNNSKSNLKNSTKIKGSFDNHYKINLNNFEKKLPEEKEKENKKKKSYSNNKTITNYINDFDNDILLNDSLNNKIMKNLKTTNKRSESYNNLDYKNFDLIANSKSKRTISQNMDEIGIIYNIYNIYIIKFMNL